MDIILLLKALILGVVEGLTEFLPISSTGHLILAGDLLNFNDDRGKLFEIVIQSGAILAVVWEYRERLAAPSPASAASGRPTAWSSTCSSPSCRWRCSGSPSARPSRPPVRADPGGHRLHPRRLRDPVGRAQEPPVRIETVDEMRPMDAVKMGIAQAFALIPGTSRSGSTIIGGMLFGLSRKAATEFSFFLAIPTLGVATVYQVYKERALLSADDLGMWIVGFISAFVSAFLCVRWLLRYISSHDFVPFAWYRIAFGIVVLATWHFGLVEWTAH
jgi:undecaprenyl-diphosphatase